MEIYRELLHFNAARIAAAYRSVKEKFGCSAIALANAENLFNKRERRG
jgi:hypothetical protein